MATVQEQAAAAARGADGRTGGRGVVRRVDVRMVDCARKAELTHFVRLERELMRGEPLFVPATDAEIEKFLAGRSALCGGIEQALFVASRQGRDVARCAAFVNRHWQEHHGEPAGFIGLFAAAAGAEAEVVEMLDRAEEWLGRRGVRRVIAPYNGHAAVGLFGMQTGAFSESLNFPYAWTPPRYVDYLDAADYRPSYPWWTFTTDLRGERYRQASRRALAGARCRVRPIDKRRWSREWETLTGLWNEGFSAEWEFHPYAVAELREFFDPMKPFVDPRQYLIAEVDGEPAGFCLGFPDLGPLLRKAGGRFGPATIARLALTRFGPRRLRPRRAGLVAIALLPQYRGRRIGQALAATLYRRYAEMGLREVEYGLVNDSNRASRSLAESLGGEGRVIFHHFDKRLD